MDVVESIFSGNEMNRLLQAQFRKGVDPREQPMYTVAEAANYVGIQSATLSTWVRGRYYHTKAGRKFWERVIAPADADWRLLSFFNLAEAHILAATRYKHNVAFPVIRQAISYIEKRETSAHPLLSRDFFTDGKELFLKTIEETINVSRGHEQLGLKPILESYLERIVFDDQFRPRKIFPLIKGQPEDKVISIVEGVSSGRPIVDGTGIQVSVLWGRWKAGDSFDDLADDFDISPDKVKRAIQYVEYRKAA